MLSKRPFNKTRYSFKQNDTAVSVWTTPTWYIFTKDEAKEFITKQDLYVATTDDGKLKAYFTTRYHPQYITEYRYLLCPLCKNKNFLPVKSLILK